MWSEPFIDPIYHVLTLLVDVITGIQRLVVGRWEGAVYRQVCSSCCCYTETGCGQEGGAALPFIVMTIIFKPYQRGIYCDDESIMYPLKPDTITHGMLAAVTISCTVIIISSGEAYLVYSKRIYSNSDFNQYVAALYKVVGTFLFGASVSQSLTDLAKFTIGRPRPNFMSVCNPKVCTGYMQVINCTGVHEDVTESRLSFYSGHSSFGMYCMLFLALYVQARLVAKLQAPLERRAGGAAAGALVALLNVCYVSDFFKKRPPRCTRQNTADNEEPERKASLQIVDSENSNHYNHRHNPGPV
ncbi:Phospholipid phosphatase 2 [Dissostichus eleginoides]|uniref:Phospholipid phosphatase 2 n=1 Tax=Dissostichus eleginoides TaxID=100907 RepID=A0AAD9C5J0_DISEL|nr:Phospholipid phosphatase 2 [Dissostichus eleginoides]